MVDIHVKYNRSIYFWFAGQIDVGGDTGTALREKCSNKDGMK